MSVKGYEMDKTTSNNIRGVEYLNESYVTINIVSEILEEIISDNNESIQEEEEEFEFLRVFECKNSPLISINSYMKRIIKYSKPERSTIILMLIYIDKICENTKMQLKMKNIHRLLLTSILIALKYNEDNFFSNEYYSKVGG